MACCVLGGLLLRGGCEGEGGRGGGMCYGDWEVVVFVGWDCVKGDKE